MGFDRFLVVVEAQWLKCSLMCWPVWRLVSEVWYEAGHDKTSAGIYHNSKCYWTKERFVDNLLRRIQECSKGSSFKHFKLSFSCLEFKGIFKLQIGHHLLTLMSLQTCMTSFFRGIQTERCWRYWHWLQCQKHQ